MMLARLACITRAYNARVGPLVTRSTTPMRSLRTHQGITRDSAPPPRGTRALMRHARLRNAIGRAGEVYTSHQSNELALPPATARIECTKSDLGVFWRVGPAARSGPRYVPLGCA